VAEGEDLHAPAGAPRPVVLRNERERDAQLHAAAVVAEGVLVRAGYLVVVIEAEDDLVRKREGDGVRVALDHGEARLDADLEVLAGLGPHGRVLRLGGEEDGGLQREGAEPLAI